MVVRDSQDVDGGAGTGPSSLSLSTSAANNQKLLQASDLESEDSGGEEFSNTST